MVPERTAQVILGPDTNAHLIDAGSADALRLAVAYVAGMTDRFACERGIVELNWERNKLPKGVGVPL